MRIKLPEDQRRVRYYGRMRPDSYAFLKSLGQPNLGRAIDKAVEILESQVGSEQVIAMSQPAPPTNA